MNQKNESKELCKLLGIKLRYFTEKWEVDAGNREEYLAVGFFDTKEKAEKWKDQNKPIEEIYIDFEKPENTIKLLILLTGIFTNFTINTDTEGNITISWFHFETQWGKEFLNISKNLPEAIIRTAIEGLKYRYITNEIKRQAQKENWS